MLNEFIPTTSTENNMTQANTTKDYPTIDHTVAEIHQRWPGTIPVFLRHHMKCVGCTMAAFETLEDALKIYQIQPEPFLAELRQGASSH